MRKSKINLRISNSLPSTERIILFNSSRAGNNNTLINQRTQYIWDVTAETFVLAITVSLQVKRTASSPIETLTETLQTASLQGLVDALNSMQVGIFFSYTSLGSTFVSTLNDTFVYTNLDINTSNNYSYLFTFNTPATGNWFFIVNNATQAINLVTDGPTILSGAGLIPTNQWAPGDNIVFDYQQTSGLIPGFATARLFRNNVQIGIITTAGVNPATLNANLVSINDVYRFTVDFN